jgi:hypothetical protein
MQCFWVEQKKGIVPKKIKITIFIVYVEHFTYLNRHWEDLNYLAFKICATSLPNKASLNSRPKIVLDVSTSQSRHGSRVARWHVFKPKILIFVNFWSDLHWKIWSILETFGLFTAIWNILWKFGRFCGYLFGNFWYAVPRKIWQPWMEGESARLR